VRKTESISSNPLPSEVVASLEAEFAKFDPEGTGFIHKDHVVPLIITKSSSIYDATEEEITNTMRYLTGGETISRDDFVIGYQRVAVTMGLGADYFELTRTFNMELQCIAKSGTGHNLLHQGEYESSVIQSAEEELGAECVSQIDARFADLAQENGGSLTRHDVGEMLRNCFMPPKGKMEMVMNFFDANDDKVALQNFLHGMTLLYGDLTLLADAARRELAVSSGSNTPLGSPSQMFDPLAQ